MLFIWIFPKILLFLLYIYIFEKNNFTKIPAYIFRIILYQTCYLTMVYPKAMPNIDSIDFIVSRIAIWGNQWFYSYQFLDFLFKKFKT